MKNLKAKKHWDIYAISNGDLLIIGAVLSAAGTDWDVVNTTLSNGERVHQSIRVFCGKRRSKKLQDLLAGMAEVGCFKGVVSYETYPHR